METSINIRFRHSNGDVGPFTFVESVSVDAVKEKLLAEWPQEGPLAQEVPTQAQDIKLIISGKWCEGSKFLKDYRREMGEITPESVVTMLVVIRKTQPAAANQTGPTKTESQPPKAGCTCVIC